MRLEAGRCLEAKSLLLKMKAGLRLLGVMCLAASWPQLSHAAGSLKVVVAPPQARLLPVLEERFARHLWTASIEQRPRIERAALVNQNAGALKVYVDLQTAGWARLVFISPAGERFSIRDLAFPQGLNEVALETIGLVVDTAVDSLFSGLAFELSRNDAEVALQQAPAPPLAPAPASAPALASAQSTAQSVTVPRPAAPQRPQPAPAVSKAATVSVASPSPWQRYLAGGYTATPQGSEALAWMSGPTLVLGQIRDRTLLQLDLTWLPAAQIQAQPLRGSLSSAVLRTNWGWYHGRGTTGFALVPLRAGVDVMRVEPATAVASGSAVPSGTRTFVSPMLGVGLAGFWSPTHGIKVAAYLSGDLDILGTDFHAQSSGAEVPVATLWRVRPSASVVVGWGQ